MVDLVNIGLRTLMCLAFLIWVVRPMLMALVYREPRLDELEDVAETAVHNAFNAWRLQQGPKYYDNPEHALLVLQRPELLNPPAEAPAPEAAEVGEVAKDQSAQVQDGQLTPGEPTPVEAAPPSEVQAASEVAVPAEAVAAGGAQLPAVVAEEEGETLEQMRDRIKKEQKKNKPTIPTELLENANSYEDKLMVLRMIVDQDKGRVASALRRMVTTD